MTMVYIRLPEAVDIPKYAEYAYGPNYRVYATESSL